MRLLVLGAGVSGIAAARLAARLGHDVTVYDQDLAAAARAAEDDIAAVGHEWDRSLLTRHDVVVTSPGIPESAAPLRDALAAEAPVWSELEFAARHLETPYVAVTGTNGKTTVTAAATAMLVAGGVEAVAAGNIGNALSDVIGTAHEVVVVEASSFQLRFIETFHPRGAALLNIAPDHLDWHGSIEAYTAAKARVFENQREDDFVVYDADDAAAASAVARAPAVTIPASGRSRPDGGNGPDGGALVVDGHRLPRPDLDPAYLLDLTAAATLAHQMGASPDGIAAAIDEFEAPRHRRTVVGEWADVRWVNDSKATNPHAALASVAAYPSVVLIAGGRNKGLDLAPIATAPSVRSVVGIGEARDELRLAAPERYVDAGSMKDAVSRAAEIAVAGDVVLLAPGCASFDMFENYEARGNAFEDAARAEMGE